MVAILFWFPFTYVDPTKHQLSLLTDSVAYVSTGVKMVLLWLLNVKKKWIPSVRNLLFSKCSKSCTLIQGNGVLYVSYEQYKDSP